MSGIFTREQSDLGFLGLPPLTPGDQLVTALYLTSRLKVRHGC
jgi:hypothetical protein